MRPAEAARRRRCAVLGRVVLALLLIGMTVAAAAQRRGSSRGLPPNLDYDGRFVFSRIRYGGGGWGFRWGASAWSHDYPRADQHLSRILEELTSIEAAVEGTNVYVLDDAEMFKNPVIYVSEPGFWSMSDAEAESLRRYLLKGGFIIFDDFELQQWDNFAAQMRRVLPERRPIEIDARHPIFRAFFDLKTIYFPHPMVSVTPSYFGYFENDDPTDRMIGIVNYNNDVAEYWEWSDTGFLPIDYTNEAYKLGVNYIVYAMTH